MRALATHVLGKWTRNSDDALLAGAGLEKDSHPSVPALLCAMEAAMRSLIGADDALDLDAPLMEVGLDSYLLPMASEVRMMTRLARGDLRFGWERGRR